MTPPKKCIKYCNVKMEQTLRKKAHEKQITCKCGNKTNNTYYDR